MNIHKKTTPRKIATGKSVQTCRVCNTNVSEDVHRVFLYGRKSERDGVLECLQEFSSEDQKLIREDDGLSKYICRTCESKILSFVKTREELKSLLFATETANRRSCEVERFKRGRRDDENVRGMEVSPSAVHVKKKTKPLASCTKLKIILAPRFNIPASPRVSLVSRFVSSGQNTTTIQEEINMESQFTSHVVTGSVLTDNEKRLDHSNASIQPRILPDFLKSKQQCDVSSVKNGLDILKKAGIHEVLNGRDDTKLSLEQQNSICREVIMSTPSHFATIIMNIPKLEREVKGIILNKINNECKTLSSKRNPSILHTPRVKHNKLAKEFKWESILKEIKERAPYVLDILATIAAPKIKLDGRQVPPICTAYALLMNTRNQELSMVQKMNTVILGAGHATQKALSI